MADERPGRVGAFVGAVTEIAGLLVVDWNQPATDFYRSLGAAPLEEWTTFRIGGPALEALAGG